MLRQSEFITTEKALDLASLVWLVYFLFIFSVIFVGDYYFSPGGIFAYWLLLIAGAWFIIPLTGAVGGALLISAPFVILLLAGSAYKSIDAAYYQAPIFALISIAFLGRLEALISSPKTIIFGFSFFCLAAFSLFVFIFDSGSSRTSLVFGPTILYRVILFFYGYCLLFLIPRDRSLLIVFSSALAFYSVLKIGSRGGIVSLGVIWLLALRGRISWRLLAWSGIIFCAALIIFGIEDISSSRAFYFSSDSESTNVRLDKLRMVSYFLEGDEVFFGMSNPTSLVGNYPHNIFAEILIFHGLLAFLLFCIMNLTTIFFALRINEKNNWIYKLIILMSPILIGSQFSGSLMDNYFYISLMCYIIASVVCRRRAVS